MPVLVTIVPFSALPATAPAWLACLCLAVAALPVLALVTYRRRTRAQAPMARRTREPAAGRPYHRALFRWPTRFPIVLYAPARTFPAGALAPDGGPPSTPSRDPHARLGPRAVGNADGSEPTRPPAQSGPAVPAVAGSAGDAAANPTRQPNRATAPPNPPRPQPTRAASRPWSWTSAAAACASASTSPYPPAPGSRSIPSTPVPSRWPAGSAASSAAGRKPGRPTCIGTAVDWYTPIAYSIVLHALYGQTLGKRILGIRVLDVSGGKLRPGQAVLRDAVNTIWPLLYLVSAWPLLTQGQLPVYKDVLPPTTAIVAVCGMLGWTFAELLVMLTNLRRRSLHDYIAGSVVVRKTGGEWRV